MFRNLLLSVTVLSLFYFTTSCNQKITTNPQLTVVQRANNQLLKVFSSGDISLLDNIIAPDFINHTSRGNVKGMDSLKIMVKSFHGMFKPSKMVIKRQWADGEYGIDWIRYTNSDSSSVIEGMEMTRFVEGKAIEHWFFPNSQPARSRKQ